MCNPLARSAGVFLLAKIGADTAENEQHFAEILPKTGNDRARSEVIHLRPQAVMLRALAGAMPAPSRGGGAYG